MGDVAKVRRGGGLFAEPEHAIEALVSALCVEVGWARGGERERFPPLEPRVHEPERVPGVHGPGLGIVHDQVMLGVSRGVVRGHRRVPQRERVAVLENANAALRDGQNRPVDLAKVLLPVDGRGALHELLGSDEVARGAGMREQGRVGAGREERAGSTRVVEVGVCNDDVVDVLGLLSSPGKGVHQHGNGVARVALDERTSVARDSEVGADVPGGLRCAVDGVAFVLHGAECRAPSTSWVFRGFRRGRFNRSGRWDRWRCSSGRNRASDRTSCRPSRSSHRRAPLPPARAR